MNEQMKTSEACIETGMDRRAFLGAGAAFAALVAMGGTAKAADAKDEAKGAAAIKGDGKVVELPKVEKTGGKSIYECLSNRRSNHSPASNPLTLEQLSRVLWAACGVNDEEREMIVIPTSKNSRKVEVYAVMPDGVWQYQRKEHSIRRVLNDDYRKELGGAGTYLLYTAADDNYSPMYSGSMYMNVSLVATSEGLDQCVKNVKKVQELLTSELPLPEGWKIHNIQALAQKDA